MKFFRWIAIFLTQMPLIYFVAGSRDMLHGFNQTSAGFNTLIFLFFAAPLLDILWTVLEVRRFIKPPEGQRRTVSFLMPLVAICFLAEALVIDLYILSHARM